MSWATAKFSEVATIERNSVAPAAITSGTTYVGLEHISSGGESLSPVQVEAGELSSNKFAFDADTILFGKLRPYLAKVVAPSVSGVCSTDILPIRPGGDLDKKFLLHFLLSPKQVAYVANRATGANLPRLSPKELAAMEIPLPPLEEQRRIAGILDAADALRRRRREALALLDTLPGAIFAEMFGDPRDNPLSYPARKLSDLCSRITVGVVIKPASYYVDDGVPALRSVNVREGGFDFKDMKYFSQETNDGPLKKSKLKKGDVVIVRTGQPGRAAVVEEEIVGANCIDMLIASPKEDELLPYFLEAFLNSEAGRQMALSNQTGQVQQHLNATALKGIDFITPPIEEQREFARRLDEIRRAKERLNVHLCELETLFASLQSRAFAGEL
ncbi:restriction endonuclease subunit S [Sagittula salina]|uniref:Restriction endonuclease subunit S n=1 Tax=Sagittula salina TaxID=2820268 RepID=A0A940MWB0_9RHOB|nr:restriction endonuclease subunit S [Sagittula salina]MBP0484049.1 restriction endonuclease subunit S [Sagittula salina]